MHSPDGTAHNNHQNFESYYQNNVTQSKKKYHEAVLDLYFKTAREAQRVLKKNWQRGPEIQDIVVLKC